jgi:hypothetical protein
MRVAILLMLCATALADEAVAVRVGETVRKDVGYLRGLMCDDPGVVEATIATDEKRDVNVVSFKGIKEGRTSCRVGTEIGRPARLFAVDVTRR